MRQKSLRLAAVSLSAIALGSCSYGYELLAVVIDGQLAFVVDPRSRYDPDCFSSVHVQVDDNGPIAHAAAGDDKELVRNGGVYWWKSFNITECRNTFPIFYGQRLEGTPFVYRDGGIGSVEAKPLRIGVLYTVNTSGDGAYGAGWFRINEGGWVENFTSDPTPAVVNEQGYDVTDYANMTVPPGEGTYTPQASPKP